VHFLLPASNGAAPTGRDRTTKGRRGIRTGSKPLLEHTSGAP